MILAEIDKVFGKFAIFARSELPARRAMLTGLPMDFNNLPVLQMMTKKMSWLSHRTEIISQNVAHGDTPCFKAKDLKQVSFRDLVRKEGNQNGFPPNRTHGTHLVGLQARTPFATEGAPDAHETTLDKNDVSIEQQLTKLGETQMAYQTTLNLYRKHLELLRTALTRPGR